MKTENLFQLFNISKDSEDDEVKEICQSLINKTENKSEQKELERKYQKISTKQKRYIYFLTSTEGFTDISELDSEIISRPNYIGPRQWMELLD